MPQPGSPFYSVTEVLSVLGLGRYSHSRVPEGVLERAGTRGSILHASFAHHLMGPNSRFPDGRNIFHTVEGLQPYQDAFERAVSELGIGTPLYAEYAMRNDRLALDGTLDYFGPVHAACNAPNDPAYATPAFVDFKTGEPRGRHPDGSRYDVHPSVGLQVAGYAALLGERGRLAVPVPGSTTQLQPIDVNDAPRFALYLLNDATYRFIPLDDPSDRATMLACVRVANLARRLTRTERPA